MLEIKQNELNTHMCIIYLGRAGIYSPIFIPDTYFYPKNILHFWTMCNFQKPLQPPGILHFQKIRPGCQKGNVFHSHLPLNFQPPDHFP